MNFGTCSRMQASGPFPDMLAVALMQLCAVEEEGEGGYN